MHQYNDRLKRLELGCQNFPEKPYNLIQQLNSLSHPHSSLMINNISKSYSLWDEPRIYVSGSTSERPLIYCDITKCGSTNWKRTLVEIDKMMSGEIVESKMGSTDHSWKSRKDQEGFRIRKSPPRRKRSALDRLEKGGNRWDSIYVQKLYKTAKQRSDLYTNPNNFKYLFVRDPLERLLSAYRDKVQPVYNSHPIIGVTKITGKNQIKKLFNKNLTLSDPRIIDLDTISFQSFLYGIFIKWPPQKPSQSTGAKIRHWHKFYDLCRVCSIKYDFIGKVETINVDSELVMSEAGVENRIHMGLHGRSSDNSKMIMYFKGLRKKFILQLYDLYREDFELFGYTVNSWLWSHLKD